MFSSKMLLVFKFKASIDDVIIGNLQEPSYFHVSQCIKSKVSDLDYFDLLFSKMLYIFNFKACMTS